MIHGLMLICFAFAFADIPYVASLSVNVNGSSRSRVTLKCFSDSFSGVEDLPSTNRPVDGRGLLIDLTAPTRWQPFATWILKLVCKSLTEGTLYVEGLIRASFISAACSLLCDGNADLHMVCVLVREIWNWVFLLHFTLIIVWLFVSLWKACFDFVHIIGMVTNYDAIPCQNSILSIATILNLDKGGFLFSGLIMFAFFWK